MQHSIRSCAVCGAYWTRLAVAEALPFGPTEEVTEEAGS